MSLPSPSLAQQTKLLGQYLIRGEWIYFCGNHRPNACYAADYRVYPVAAFQNTNVNLLLTSGNSL